MFKNDANTIHYFLKIVVINLAVFLFQVSPAEKRIFIDIPCFPT